MIYQCVIFLYSSEIYIPASSMPLRNTGTCLLLYHRDHNNALLCMYFRQEMRQLSFLSKSLDPGNVCPACPRVSVLLQANRAPCIITYLHARTQGRLFMLLMLSLDYHARDLLDLVIGILFIEVYSLWISVLLMNTLVPNNCTVNQIFRYSNII